MILFHILILCALIICLAPFSHCFFFRSPLNWFGFGRSSVSNAPNVSVAEPIASSFDNISTTDPSITIMVPTIQPEHQFPVVPPFQPIQPLPPSVPIKINRFGLEPLPYPLKQIPSRFPVINSQNLHFDHNSNLNRRYGDLKNEESTIHSSIESSETMAKHEETLTEGYFSTLGSIKESNNNAINGQNVSDSNKNKYQTSDELSQENIDNFTPMPVYIASSTNADNVIPTENTSLKPLFLNRAEYAAQLNDMYYNKPEVFQPMMDQFKEKAI